MKFADIKTVSADDYQNWTMVVPVISTIHVPQSDIEPLWDCGLMQSDGSMISTTIIVLDGSAEELKSAGVSEGTLRILDALVANGYCWVRFDPDGEVFEDLAKFEW